MIEIFAQFFLWLDASPDRYVVTSWFCFGVFLFLSVTPAQAKRWQHPFIYIISLAIMMLAFRWPMIAMAGEANPDESQLLAGALTAWHRGQVWSIDMGYCSLWAFLPLTLPAFIGWPIDFFGGRCVTFLMTLGSLFFLWLGLRHLFTDRWARILILPLACLYGFTPFWDFLRYTGEQSAQLCLAVTLYLIITAFSHKNDSVSCWRLLLAGMTLGALPFTKLQAAPQGVLLGVFTLATVLSRGPKPWKQRVKPAAFLLAGVILMTGGTLLAIVTSGNWFHFFQSYLRMGLAYSGIRTFENIDFLPMVRQMVWSAEGLPYYWAPATAAIFLAIFFVRRSQERNFSYIIGLLFLFGGYFVIWAAGRGSSHYLIFLILPTAFLLMALYGSLIADSQSHRQRILWLVIFISLTVAPQIVARLLTKPPADIGQLRYAHEAAAGPLARFLKPFIRPGDTMTVWGWACTYHVQTQIPQGTREGHTERQMLHNQLQPYFRERFLDNLKHELPVFFIDAVGEGCFRFTNRNLFGHDRWTELQTIVNGHYLQIGEEENVRIYLRLDRLKEQQSLLKNNRP